MGRIPLMTHATIADLHVEIVGSDQPPGAPLVVLLHGFDCFARDLSPFGASLGLPARYVFPEAPFAAAAGTRGGRGWWPIDAEWRSDSLARGEPRDLSRIVPEGLDRARNLLARLLDDLERTLLPADVIIGGFSQGAMLTCDLALRSSRRLAGLVLLSGARICAEQWTSLYASRAGLPVFMSHGRSDPDLSFRAAERLRDDLIAAGMNVTWLPFDGGHEVGLPALRGLKRFLSKYGSDRGA